MQAFHLALVAEHVPIALSDLESVANALNKQIARDFGPYWGVTGIVKAYARSKDIPQGHYQVKVLAKLDDPSAEGYHDTADGLPYAVVQYDADWTLTASHEALEMIADPAGTRMMPGWIEGQRVNVLVEVCDPCEADECAYQIDGIKVSDFVTPAYFDPYSKEGPYCFSGRLDGPRELHKDGYYSWSVVSTEEWKQRDYFGDQPTNISLGRLIAPNGNFRAAVDKATRARRAP